MQKNTHIFCRGEEYTKRNEVTQCVCGYTLMRKCTQQKRFLQDERNVNNDSKKHR